MTVREFIEACNFHVRVRWFDKYDHTELFDIDMPNESKHHFRDRNIYMMFPANTTASKQGYLLDIYVYPNVEEDQWLRPKVSKSFRVKTEYLECWGINDETIVTSDEIKQLAREWNTSVEKLMEQVDEI